MRADRLKRAYAIAHDASVELRVGNDPASGTKLLLRAAVVELTAAAGKIDASEFVLRLAEEVFNETTLEAS